MGTVGSSEVIMLAGKGDVSDRCNYYYVNASLFSKDQTC